MLTKKDKKKRYNKREQTVPFAHTFGEGITASSRATAKEAFSGSNLGGSIGAIAGGVAGVAQAGMANDQIADTTDLTNEREERLNWQSSATDNASLLDEMASDVTIGQVSWQDVRGLSGGQMAGNTINGMVSGASAGAQVGGGWGAIAGAAAGLISGITGIFTGNAKAKKEAARLNSLANKANLSKAQNLTAKAGVLDQAADQRALAAYAAYGGGINAPKFSMFPSEVTEFNTGGSHEENPYDGIPQGIAPDGLPNLVEEGEVKYNNYIFSDRLMLSKNDKKKYKFLKGKTYADAAKAIKRELGIDERPNDLIAKTDLEEHLNILSTLQEEERAKRGLRGENRMMYDKGGHLFAGNRQEIRDYMDSGFTRREARNLAKGNFNLNEKTFNWNSILQAAPTIGSVISGLIQSSQGHDRSIANKLYNYEPERSHTEAPQVTTPRINVSKYKIDEEQAARENDAMVLATMRAARESSTNPLAVMPQINAVSYAGQIASGKARADAKKTNFDIEMAGNQFNLGIDQLQGNFDLAAEKLNAAERDAYNKLKYQALATGASADIRSKESYEDALGKTWTSAAENINTLAHDKIYDEMVAEYLKNKNLALGGPLSIQKSKNKVRGKKRNRLV